MKINKGTYLIGLVLVIAISAFFALVAFGFSYYQVVNYTSDGYSRIVGDGYNINYWETLAISTAVFATCWSLLCIGLYYYRKENKK